jgi:hypothetical protein
MILEYLENNKGLHSTEDIVKGTHASYGAVARACRRLFTEKRVKRRSGAGHSYLYEFVTHEIADKKSSAKNRVVPGAVGPSVDPITNELLRGYINKWLTEGWKVQTPLAAQELLNVIADLCKYMWIDVTQGSGIDQTSLDMKKTQLQTARNVARNFSDFFDKLLVTNELWDSKKLTMFVLDGVDDPQDFLESARTVNESLL